MNTQGMIPAKENASKKISDRYQKKTYAKGATCIYGDTLYRAKADITTAEEWTAAHWEETNMETIRAEMAAEVSSLNAKSQITRKRITIEKVDHTNAAPYYNFATAPKIAGKELISARIYRWGSNNKPFTVDRSDYTLYLMGETGTVVTELVVDLMYYPSDSIVNVS